MTSEKSSSNNQATCKQCLYQGSFLGQYSGSRDFLKAIWDLEFNYNDIKIDWGNLWDFEPISQEVYDSIASDSLSSQEFFKRITSYPLNNTTSFDGYTLHFSEVKITDVAIQRTSSEQLGKTVGDIRCVFYGKISKSENYTVTEYIEETTINIPDIKIRPVWVDRGTSTPGFDGLFSGCFSLIGYTFGLFGVGLLMAFFIGIGWIPSLFLFGFIGLVWLFNKLVSGNSTVNKGIGCISSVFSGLTSLTVLLIMGWALVSLLIRSCDSQSDSTYQPPSPVVSDQEKVSQERIVTSTDLNNQHRESVKPVFDTLIVNTRIWKDYHNDIHQIELAVAKRDINLSSIHRNQFYMTQGFGGLYNSISSYDTTFLKIVYSALDSLRSKKQMDSKRFVEAIVSMVQDIPYKLILDTECSEAANESKFIREFLDNCTSDCCLGNIKFGVQTPTEFLSNLYGDCDTRTLTIFTILDHFGYDVAIINSEQLAHSMIAINLPYDGTYKIYNNKRYYLWETTNIGFVPGYVAPTYDNIQLWNVVLISK